MIDKYLIWWTSQADHERIVPLESWPIYLYHEFQSRGGRAGRGRLWVSGQFADDPEMPHEATFSDDNWLCRAASDAGGIVLRASDVHHVQFLPGFVTTFAMALPSTAPTPPPSRPSSDA